MTNIGENNNMEKVENLEICELAIVNDSIDAEIVAGNSGFYLGSLFETIGQRISRIIDFFYPPFRKYMTIRFFRYGVTGSANLVFDWVLYYIIYAFILQHRMLHLGFVTLSSHIATLVIKFPIVLFSGFLLQKYITFSTSDIKGRIQLFRYLVVVIVNLFFNYIGLKILVDGLGLYPSLSNIIVSVLSVFISYVCQKRYTFKDLA